MKLQDAIIKWSDTGCVELDLKKAIKYFNKKSIISKWHNEYTLCRYTHKNNLVLKVTITEQNAKYLIQKLNLVEIRSTIFVHGSTFKLK